ncbi:FxLYD domain-containing protein [Lachnospira multipara]|uniref:FxLYD domain-containing protein n=1 Tax=Lachnospira multipara TaxID=28051 RepID=UPI0004881ECF|nr:FxLYD domain-containing protein [Lachnospira multipara]
MRSVKKTFDINAHVINITNQIYLDNGQSLVSIGFENLGYGTITAIKFDAKAYNIFGDLVKINGKESFYLIIQDICVERNTVVTNLKATLPSTEVRKLELTESQVCFSDGRVLTYEGENYKEYELEQYDVLSDEREISIALKDRFGGEFKYKAIECEEGWICGCGRFNKSEAICSNCGCTKKDAFYYTDDDNKSYLINTYNKAVEKRKEIERVAAQNNAEKKKVETRKKLLITIIGVAMLVLLVGSIIYANIMSSRIMFASAEKMKNEVTGIYTVYTNYNPQYIMSIHEDTVTVRQFDSSGKSYDKRYTIDAWNPNKGTIIIDDDTIIVTNTGDIQYGGYLYKKGGSWITSLKDSSNGSSDSSRSGSSTSESSGLKIENVKVTSNSLYTKCTGTIKNTGKKTYKFIEIKGAFKDSKGNVIDTDWTYAVGAEGLAPNEASTFTMSVDQNFNIVDCKVTVYDFDY